MDQLLAGIDGVIAYMDDMIVIGKTEADHQRKLNMVLQRISEWDFRLQLDKCSLYMSQIKFLGAIVSKRGIETDPAKVSAIESMPPPKDIATLRSFLGFVNYYGKFVPNLHSLKAPLENLLRKDKGQ